MRKLYSQRNLGDRKISFEVVKDLFLDLFENFKQSGYLKENFGYFYYIDLFTHSKKSYVDGKNGSLNLDAINSIEKYFFRKLKRKSYPNESNFKKISQEDFFDVVELVFDLISKPIIVEEDAFAVADLQSRGETNAFDKEIAKKEYVERVNEILNDFGFEIRKNGEIWALPQQGMEKLVEEALKTDNPKSFEEKIEHAKDLFFSKTSTTENKRSACKTLGDVLELIKKDLPAKDKSDLFNVMNNFSIRHHNKAQKKISKGELEWAFYVLLATANHFIKLKKKS